MRADVESDRAREPSADERPPSAFQLFNAIIVVRWVALAVSTAGYLRNLTTHELDYGGYIPALALAVGYTLVLTVLSRRALDLHTRGPVLLAVDYSVSFAVLCMAGGVWTPFLIYAMCSTAIAGLRGRREGVLGGAALVAMYLLSLVVRGITFQDLAAAGAVALVIVYSLEFTIFAVVWAYATGLVSLFDEAVVQSAEARDELARANERLDRHHRELLALQDIREAALNRLDVERIPGIVLDSLKRMGFVGARVLLHGDPRPRTGADEVSVVIGAGEESVGTLIVERPEGGLSAEEAQMLGLFADQIALAVQHVRLFEQGREHAIGSERNRIAVEIHDAVMQKVYGANLLAESAPEEAFPEAGPDGLPALRDAIGGSLRELRVSVLNWDSLGWDLPLARLVERYLEEFADVAGLRVSLTASGRERVVQRAKRKDLLAILQEALSNSWRHARASSIAVALVFEGERVCLSVTDDGSGFDTDAGRGAGAGLEHLRERAESHGGDADVASSLGEGTRVTVAMPL